MFLKIILSGNLVSQFSVKNKVLSYRFLREQFNQELRDGGGPLCEALEKKISMRFRAISLLLIWSAERSQSSLRHSWEFSLESFIDCGRNDKMAVIRLCEELPLTSSQ